MKRAYVYDVEVKKPKIITGHSHQKKESSLKPDSSLQEKKSRALETLKNAGILSDVVKTFEKMKLNDHKDDEEKIKDAINKISTVIDELKSQFKKDYWE